MNPSLRSPFFPLARWKIRLTPAFIRFSPLASTLPSMARVSNSRAARCVSAKVRQRRTYLTLAPQISRGDFAGRSRPVSGTGWPSERLAKWRQRCSDRENRQPSARLNCGNLPGSRWSLPLSHIPEDWTWYLSIPSRIIRSKLSFSQHFSYLALKAMWFSYFKYHLLIFFLEQTGLNEKWS